MPFNITAHYFGMRFQSFAAYLLNARLAVRSEYERKQFRNCIIKLLALTHFFKIDTVRTRPICILAAAAPDAAPAGLCIFLVAGTFLFYICGAGAAIQSAICDKSCVIGNLSHTVPSSILVQANSIQGRLCF